MYLYNNENNKPNNILETFGLNELRIKKSSCLEIELHKGGVLGKMNPESVYTYMYFFFIMYEKNSIK